MDISTFITGVNHNLNNNGPNEAENNDDKIEEVILKNKEDILNNFQKLDDMIDVRFFGFKLVFSILEPKFRM